MRWRSTVRSIFALGVYLVNSGSQRISLGEYCNCVVGIFAPSSLWGQSEKSVGIDQQPTTRSIMHMRISFDKNKLTGVGTRTCVWWVWRNEYRYVKQRHWVQLRSFTLWISQPITYLCRPFIATAGLSVATRVDFISRCSQKASKPYCDLLNTKHHTTHHLSCCYNSK